MSKTFSQPLYPDQDVQIHVTLPAARISSGSAMVICPGGGYHHRAEHEGSDVADYLALHGIAGIVVDYRYAPNRHPIPLQDASRAVRTVRHHASEWNIQPDKIGIIGFSAGGHLASTVCTQFDAGDSNAADPIHRHSSRPDLAVLAYPVIDLAGPFAAKPSRDNLLGPDASDAARTAQSSHLNVQSNTPPTFLFHTTNDGAVPVENALLYATALRDKGVEFEMHLFQSGPHGVGLAKSKTQPAELSHWPELMIRWLRMRGF